MKCAAVMSSSLAAGGANRTNPPAGKPLRLLMLVGTGFIGPYQVRYAVSRGHKVTVD